MHARLGNPSEMSRAIFPKFHDTWRTVCSVEQRWADGIGAAVSDAQDEGRQHPHPSRSWRPRRCASTCWPATPNVGQAPTTEKDLRGGARQPDRAGAGRLLLVGRGGAGGAGAARALEGEVFALRHTVSKGDLAGERARLGTPYGRRPAVRSSYPHQSRPCAWSLEFGKLQQHRSLLRPAQPFDIFALPRLNSGSCVFWVCPQLRGEGTDVSAQLRRQAFERNTLKYLDALRQIPNHAVRQSKVHPEINHRIAGHPVDVLHNSSDPLPATLRLIQRNLKGALNTHLRIAFAHISKFDRGNVWPSNCPSNPGKRVAVPLEPVRRPSDHRRLLLARRIGSLSSPESAWISDCFLKLFKVLPDILINFEY